MIRALHEDERATAAVEFVVLLPTYLLLLTALFSLSQLTLAHQAVRMAVRFDAWTQGNRDVAPGFFGPYQGSYSRVELRAGEAVKFDEGDLKQTQGDEARLGYSGARSRPWKIAAAVLNNDLQGGDRQAAMALWSVTGRFDFQGLLLGNRQIGLMEQAAVYLPQRHRRPEHQSAAREHWIAKVDAPFDPAQENNRFFEPTVRGTFMTGWGIWDPMGRIRGNVQAEHGYYQGQMR